MSDLRAVIREVLAEELSRLHLGDNASPDLKEETVRIRNDSELQAFVQRLLSLMQDGRARTEIESGRYVFRLGSSAAQPVAAHQPLAPSPSAAPAAVRFDKGLITEREISRLPEGQRTIAITKAVRLTPLAREELRRRGIRIERANS